MQFKPTSLSNSRCHLHRDLPPNQKRIILLPKMHFRRIRNSSYIAHRSLEHSRACFSNTSTRDSAQDSNFGSLDTSLTVNKPLQCLTHPSMHHGSASLLDQRKIGPHGSFPSPIKERHTVPSLLSTITLSKTAARFQQSILLDEDLASQVSRFKPPGTHLPDSSGQAAQLSTDLMNSIKARPLTQCS